MFQTLPGLLTGFFGLFAEAETRVQMFQTLPGLLTGFFTFRSTGFLATWRSFKPFQGFLPVSSAIGKAFAKPLLARFKPFQGFLPVSSSEFADVGYQIDSFKPFQGFLPVSSVKVHLVSIRIIEFQTLPGLLTGFFLTDGGQNDSLISFCFKPFQGFLPVSSGGRRPTKPRPPCVSNPSRASYRFLHFFPTSKGMLEKKFQTLPGLLTGFFR